MARKYTYQDWKNGKTVDFPKESPLVNDFYRALYKAGNMSSDDLNAIRMKQSWAYEKILEINLRADIYLLKSELAISKYPEQYFELEKEETNNELNEESGTVELVVRGIRDFQNLQGDDYAEVKKVIHGSISNPGYKIYCMTFKEGKWVPNINLEIASLLKYKNLIATRSLKEFISEEKKRTKVNKRGDYVTAITSDEMALELRVYLDKYRRDRERVYEDGRPIVDKFIDYLYGEYPEIKERKSPSKRTLQRRTKEIVDEMTF